MKTVFATNINEWSDRDLEGLGVIRVYNGNIYRWVKVQTSPATKGAVCFYTSKDVVKVGGSGAITPAGILQADIPSNVSEAYAWILVYGFGTVITSGSISNGALVKGDNNGNVVAETEITENTIGVMIDNTSKTILVKLL